MNLQELKSFSLNSNTACSQCRSRFFCLPTDLNASELEAANQIVQTRKILSKGTYLVRAGTKFHAIYTVRSGFLKTTQHSPHGNLQSMSFQMTGDTVGLDAIATESYQSEVVALDNSEICVIPFHEIEKLSRMSSSFQHHFLQRMSLEIVREKQTQSTLSRMSAFQKAAFFIQTVSSQFHDEGFSKSEIILRISRIEIGQFLGLTQESVCRAFTKLSDSGVLTINKRDVKILNFPALGRIVSTEA